jgi:hypothetical protein
MGMLTWSILSGSKESRNARIQELEHKLHLQDERYTILEKKNKELLGENIILKREKDELLTR